MSYDPAEHTIDEVREYLAQHPEETDAVLAAEQAGKDRVTLVNSLQDDGGDETDVDDGEDAADGDAPVADHVEDPNLFPPGEYPDTGTTGYLVTETAEEPAAE